MSEASDNLTPKPRANQRWAARGAPIEVRFWRLVDRSGGPDACWPWLGNTSRDRGGYGNFKLKDGTQVKAHRMAYELAAGLPLGSSLGRHSCDRPDCCNFRHIIPGTHAQNSADMVARDRQAAGEKHGRAMITEADVRAIRASSEPLYKLANQFNIGETTVGHIIAGRTWKNVPLNPGGAEQRAQLNPFASRLTPEKVRAIRAAAGDGVGPLAKQYGVSKTTIESVLSRKAWKHID